MKKQLESLKKLKMPEKKVADQEALMDLEGLGEEEAEMPVPEEGEEMMAEEEESVESEASPLVDISDEDLIAELKKRGLVDEEA